MVSAGVNSVPEHSYWREVVPDTRVALDVVEPAGNIHILLPVLDGQVNLGKRRSLEVMRLTAS